MAVLLLTEGQYAYLETSLAGKGKNAVLSVNANGPTGCVKFWYHMFGTTIGTLRVYTKASRSLQKTTVWSKQGTQGDVWRYAQVELKQGGPFEVKTINSNNVSYMKK